jgi:N-hydroxyarylamine O-acetyltransferase
MDGQMNCAEITDEYIRVLGLNRSKPDLVFLSEIARHHVGQFAFSSVGPLLGDDLPLDVESLYHRIVVKRRGGYCFEQNALMYAMLRELGFTVSLYLGRVIYNQDLHPGLTHRITLVEIDGNRYIVDVGFGPLGPQRPVSMSGEESLENFRVFRIDKRDSGEFHMQTLKDGGFYSLYKFELARYGQADCEVGHFYSHKHPKATFVNHLVVSKILDKEVRSLRNHEFWVTTESGEQRQTIEDSQQLKMILDTQFGIRVNDTEGRNLFMRADCSKKGNAGVSP